MGEAKVADVITIQDLVDGRLDVKGMATFYNGPAGQKVPRRLAGDIETLDYYINYLKALRLVYTQKTGFVNIDGVQVKAITQAINDAIDAAAIEGNLITDTLVTTTPTLLGQVVRNQRDKNTDIINGKDFGVIADGVTDNYPMLMNAINFKTGVKQGFSQPKLVINLPQGVIYCSDTINLKGTVTLRGQCTGLSGALLTVLEFPAGKDGVIVNRHNTNGATGTVTSGDAGDGSSLIGIAVRQRGYVLSASPVLDFNANDNQFISNVAGRLFDVNESIRTLSDELTTTSTAVVVSKNATTRTLVPDRPTNASIGTVVTGATSGATGTIVYVGSQTLALAINNVVGNFIVGENLNILGSTFKLLGQNTFALTVYKVKDLVGVPTKGSIYTPSAMYGSGIILRARANIKNCHAHSFPHYGLFVKAGDGGTNANLFSVDTIDIQAIGMHGILTLGGDSNAGRVTGPNAVGCGGFGIKDASFLGNHYYSCHTSSCNSGSYFSNHQNNFSVFLGCYSESLPSLHPFQSPTARIGRESTVIGGDHGAGFSKHNKSAYGTDSGFAQLNGTAFNFGNAINALNGLEASGTLKNTVRYTGTGANASPITLSASGNGGWGRGPSLSYRLAHGGVTSIIKDDMSDTVDGGKIGIYSSKYLGSDLGIDLVQQTNISSTLLVTGGGATINATVYPIINAGSVVGLQITNAGQGYTSAPSITGTGIYANFSAELYVFNGTLVSYKIIDGLSDLPSVSAVRQLDISSDYIRPSFDNKMALGAALNRFATIYAATGAINTSDAREKSRPFSIDDAVLDAWADVNIITYQWVQSVIAKGNESARWHVGVIAQKIRDAFSSKGLDATCYGLLCFDEWADTDEVVDDNGIVLVKSRKAGHSWGIRADQCLFLEAAYQRRENRRIIERLGLLEAK